MPSLKVDIRVGETLHLSGHGRTSITLTAKSGQRARLQVVADESVRIDPPERPSVGDVVRGGINFAKASL